MPRTVWDDIIGQRRVTDLLRAAVIGDQVAHAYLFVGPPGAGKKTAAKALACAVLCDDDGCGSCGACARVRRGAHPDVRIIRPEGAVGYLAEQMRDIIHDVNLAPIEGPGKLYIVEDADRFNDASANAILKTLEEPPGDTVFVLLAHSLDTVLPTIASRCQVVRFRRLAPSEATSLLVSADRGRRTEATAALAAAGGVVARARDFLASPGRRQARDKILRTLKDLAIMDELDVLEAARDLLTAVKAPLEEFKDAQAAEVDRARRVPRQVRDEGPRGASQARAHGTRARGDRRGPQRDRELAARLPGDLAGRG